ncbi:tRNA dimethylallyltransferase [Indibacter alkaliphilus LW1]|uniref:tRNA dimethylallyltransferase n=1 Tax=Indibacter alkaliphilus (strain CCUG 57479 / KCTC 22604 / LW1) TaxID=1189612 RepID=S2DCQ4_INDAL|nr:tRNA (adenosine(37)-N6)-dimethylallyltransferase MiaA [Indibacter alkaliphilus]EOZ96957.1 tRNA dimethylallyltransferase [Indibacter alkaliphilus LW1]
MGEKKYLIVIVGPTAVGKTELCIQLANWMDTEIVSADSRQFFIETNIGTAKPSPEELSRAKHHLVDFISIENNYDVKSFEKNALTVLDNIFKERETAILTGGSGMYVDAVCKGMDDIPDVDPKIRAQVIEEYRSRGLTYLQEEVKEIDPSYFEKVDINNPQRLMRAVEVFRGTGFPFSSFRKKKTANRPFEIIKIGLERERQELYERIDRRMDIMLSEGLKEEAEKLFPLRKLNALQTVGYTEIFDFLEGKYDWEETVRLLKRNSRRYAKRQLTWFRRDEEIKWFHPESVEEIKKYIEASLVKSE